MVTAGRDGHIVSENESAEDSHAECKNKLAMLTAHMIELDQELEAESIRHERERSQLIAKISELEEEVSSYRESNFSAEEIKDLKNKNAKLEVDLEMERAQCRNLKFSLEALENRMEEDLAERTAVLHVEISRLNRHAEDMLGELEKLRASVKDTEASNLIRKNLEKTIESNCFLIDSLNEEINRLKQVCSGSDGLIDKQMISSMIVSYLSCPDGEKTRKMEMLTLLADILSLSKNDRIQIGAQQHNPLDDYTQPKLAELWAAFLTDQSS